MHTLDHLINWFESWVWFSMYFKKRKLAFDTNFLLILVLFIQVYIKYFLQSQKQAGKSLKLRKWRLYYIWFNDATNFFNFRVNKCDHCLFSTNSKDVLSNHIKRVHDGIASHICHLCSVACWYVEHKDYILHVPELILLKNKNIKIEHQYFFFDIVE